VWNNYISILSLLLERGADINLPDQVSGGQERGREVVFYKMDICTSNPH
jgi:hypothetical protein